MGNELLRQSARYGEREILIEDIDRDEMRSGFLVTSHRKKLWNVQLNLIKEFARICGKYNLRWFAYGGTLLGAVRHKGFIPWDDDVDLIMFRPDYEKFKAVVEEELKDHPRYSPYFWYNYRLESDEPSKLTDLSLPLISREQATKYPVWVPFHPVIRMLDDATTFMMRDTRKDVFRSMWIDIFCLDPSPPFFGNTTAETIFNAAKDLLTATIFPEQVRAALETDYPFFVSRKDLRAFLKLPYQLRALNYELFCLENFSRTAYVGQLRAQILTPNKKYYKTAGFDEVICLPFEKIELPVPTGYENILRAKFGDWRKLIITHVHAQEWSADIPYAEYRRKSFRFAQEE